MADAAGALPEHAPGAENDADSSRQQEPDQAGVAHVLAPRPPADESVDIFADEDDARSLPALVPAEEEEGGEEDGALPAGEGGQALLGGERTLPHHTSAAAPSSSCAAICPCGHASPLFGWLECCFSQEPGGCGKLDGFPGPGCRGPLLCQKTPSPDPVKRQLFCMPTLCEQACRI
jgi:hypothetical protein